MSNNRQLKFVKIPTKRPTVAKVKLASETSALQHIYFCLDFRHHHRLQRVYVQQEERKILESKERLR